MNAPVKLPALYAVAEQYAEAAQRLVELDLPPEVITDTLEGLAGELQIKAQTIAMIVRNLDASAASIKAAENDMAARRSAIEGRAKHLREYLDANLRKADPKATEQGTFKIECPWFRIAYKKNPPAVAIDNASVIPDRFMRVPPIPMPEPDKGAIREALKAGEAIEGARLTQSTRMEIK